MITIDGSQGEGGGQILRTALSLSLLTKTPFTIDNIRKGRGRPGLLRQHLACVDAAIAVSKSGAVGNTLSSTRLEFYPGPVAGGEHRFAIGSAGSTTLVLQTILLPLMLKGTKPSQIHISGGTHNPKAPPFEFLNGAFLSVISQMGGVAEAKLIRPGFFPAGGGEIACHVDLVDRLRPVTLSGPTDSRRPSATKWFALVSDLPCAIGERELAAAGSKAKEGSIIEYKGLGPANLCWCEVKLPTHTDSIGVFGERGVPAEQVGQTLGKQVDQFLDSGAACSEYLADQVLLPMALAGGGEFSADVWSSHAETQRQTIGLFMPDVVIDVVREQTRFAVKVGVKS